jgi:UDP-N-acetyl-D-mannosaminuronate dehydrogenase
MGPILEKESGLKIGQEFNVGYSPERIKHCGLGGGSHGIKRKRVSM